MIFDMRSAIDSAGRVVIPKPLLARLGLEQGRVVEIRERDGRIEIEPASTPMSLSGRRGGPVAVPEGDVPPLTETGQGSDQANAAVIAVDTSVVVAGFASWHEAHRSAAALARQPRVPAHVLVEAYSVLTRLPPPHRAPARLVATFLAERFREAPLALPARAHRELD
jgi:AbrB family looped-hinge helix DNA binding protein